MISNLPFGELFNVLTHDTVEALGNRLGGTTAERQARARVAEASIAMFEPRDGTEIMLACKAVTFGVMADDALNDMGLATNDADFTRAEKRVTAMGRMHMSYVKAIQAHRAELARREKAEREESAARSAVAEPTQKTIITAPAAPPAAPKPAAAVPAHPVGMRTPPVPPLNGVVASAGAVKMMGT